MNQKGFINIVLVVIVVILVGVIGYFAFVKKSEVGEESQPYSEIDTANWRTYTNSQYAFSLKYPPDWIVNDQSYISGSQKNASIEINSPVRHDIPGYESVGAKFSLQLNLNKQVIIDHAIFVKVREPKDQSVVTVQLADATLKKTSEYKIALKIIALARILNQKTESIIKNEWGISFEKTSDWAVTNNTNQQVELKQILGKWKGDEMTVQYISGEKITDQDAKFGNITYWYDQNSGKWVRAGRMNELTGVMEPSVVEVTPKFYVAGDLPIFIGTRRWLTYIIPLSHSSFLKSNITGSGYTQSLTDLVKSVKKI